MGGFELVGSYDEPMVEFDLAAEPEASPQISKLQQAIQEVEDTVGRPLTYKEEQAVAESIGEA